MGRSSFRGAAALQAAAKPRSFILDPPTKPTKAKPVLQAPDAADNNAYRGPFLTPNETELTLSPSVKILASPLRLCALTEKVLPKGQFAVLPPLHLRLLTSCPKQSL